MRMAEQVSKSQFKDKALELFRQIESSGKAVVVTDHGKPTFRRLLTTHTSLSNLRDTLSARD